VAPAGGVGPKPPWYRSPIAVLIGVVIVLAVVGGVAYRAGKGGSETPSVDASGTTTADPGITDPTVDSGDSGGGSTSGTTITPAGTTPETPDEVAAGLTRRDALGVPVLVPVGWEESDDVPGGSSSTVTFQDPNSPSKIVVGLNGCTGCVDQGMSTGGEANGVPYPEGYVPADAFGVVKLTEYAIAYARPTSIPGYSIDGIIRVTTYEGSPEGSVVTEVTLPTSEHPTASKILNYH